MTKIVYVTGGLGFIGSYVTEECLKQGWYVTCIDKITYAANPSLINYFSEQYGKRFRFIKSDINDMDDLDECDYVINLAAQSHVDRSIVNSKEFLYSNINGVHNLLEIISKKSVFNKPILLQVSTDETLGDITEGSHTEKDILKPSNPYSASKAAAEMLILSWERTFKVPYLIVRPTNNYGLYQYVEKLIPKTCKSVLLGRKIPLHNNGTPRRTWLHAADTARAIVHLINSGVKNEVYNIAGNYETSNIEVVQKIVEIITGDKDPYPYCDMSYKREGQDVRYSLDDSKLKNLGWTPVKIFDKELPSIVKYYQNNFIW